MPIDTSIYNNIKPIRIESPMNALAQMAQIEEGQNRNKLFDMKVAESEEARRSKNALARAYSEADPTKRLDSLRSVDPQAYRDESEFQIKQQKGKRDAEKAELESHLKKFEVAGQIMAGVSDQSTWERARQQTAQVFGPEAAAQMPETYDPALIEQKRMQALTVKDQLEQKWKSLDHGLNVEKFGETQRHNKSTEGIQQGQLRVSQGQLGVAQGQLGVSRERLGFEKSQPKGQYDAERGLLIDPRTGKSTQVIGPDGKAITSKDATKAPTEFQGKSAGFGARAEEADRLITELNGKYSPSAINAKASVQNTPLIGGILGAATNKMALNANDQKAEQAQRDFINAVLRQESGAAIGASEFTNAAQQYFPQPGDTKAVIDQKSRNRKLAIQGFKNSAGKAAFSAPEAPAGDIHSQADAILRSK